MPPRFLLTAEDVVAALDQRRIAGRVRKSVISILGVYADGPDFWVQIGWKRHPHETLLLRILLGVTAEQVVQLLAKQLRLRVLPPVLIASPPMSCSVSVH